MPTLVLTATNVPSYTPTSSITASPIPTITATADFCSSALWQDKIQILSYDNLMDIGPGPVAFDRILVAQNPAWAEFRQSQSGEIRTAGIIFHETAFGHEMGTGISPSVLLVTYGVEWNWQLPANGDLVSKVDHIRAVFFQYEQDWVHEKVDRSQYSMIANGATYPLYRYFDGDTSKLERWCRTYVQVYNKSPLQ